MIRKLFRNNRTDALREVIESIYLERHEKNLDFNIAIIRNDINEMQILNSSYFYKQRKLSDLTEFGFCIVISFGSAKKEYYEKFKNSRFFKYFTVFEKTKANIWYYLDCKKDIGLVLKIRKEISDEIYDYSPDTPYKIVEYTT